ncbi:MAG TPA: hypothetical protein VKZ41_00650 [Gemmatimonadales bacterium]|nr:hypothetical protein [Gemmatimonadales bacterium]
MSLRITRVYATADGHSHFEEIDIPLRDGGDIGRLSEQLAARGVIFRENDPTYDYDWHCAPQRQFIVLLDGAIELEVSDGEKRSFRGGDILLVEDTAGRGHRTRTTNGETRRSLFIPLDDSVNIPGSASAVDRADAVE